MKKAKKKETWERVVEESICQRWRGRCKKAEAVEDENSDNVSMLKVFRPENEKSVHWK
jgi:L-rhamnose mutarotase